MIVLSKEEQADTIAGHMPSGRVWNAKRVDGTVMRRLLKGFAVELMRVDAKILQFRRYILPDEDTLFMQEWESALGIPDGCFQGTGTDAERIRDIQCKLADMNISTEPEFEAFAAKFGLTVDVIPGAVYGSFPYTFPMIFFTDAKEAKFTMLVDIGEEALSFPYTFPIEFTTPELTLLKCLFDVMTPATVDVQFIILP